MDRKELTLEKGWVVVYGSQVFEYETFHEAMHAQVVIGGNLMSKSYYTYHYKEEENGGK